MTNEELIRLGQEAERMLSSALTAHVLERMRQDYIAAWLNTDHTNASQREEAWSRCKVLEDFVTHLKIVAENKDFLLKKG